MTSMEKSLSTLRIFNKFDIIVSMNKVFVSRRVEKAPQRSGSFWKKLIFQTYLKLNRKLNFSAKAKNFRKGLFISSQYGIGWFVTNQKFLLIKPSLKACLKKPNKTFFLLSSRWVDNRLSFVFNQEGDGFVEWRWTPTEIMLFSLGITPYLWSSPEIMAALLRYFQKSWVPRRKIRFKGLDWRVCPYLGSRSSWIFHCSWEWSLVPVIWMTA